MRVLKKCSATCPQEASLASPLQHAKNELDADLYRAERVYGRHAAWEKRMDIAVLGSVRRLPGLPSSFAGLDTALGRDGKIGFEDTLNGAYRLWGGRVTLIGARPGSSVSS